MFVPDQRRHLCAHAYLPSVCATLAVIAREGGRSSIPERGVMKPRSRGVLDAPFSRGMTLVLWVPALRSSVSRCSASGTRACLPDHLAELVRLRETLRRHAAGIRTGALPLGKLLHGRGEFAARGVLPGQARLGIEHGDVGQAAVLVFLQPHAAAARHLRHLVEREDQHLAVVADDRDGVAGTVAIARASFGMSTLRTCLPLRVVPTQSSSLTTKPCPSWLAIRNLRPPLLTNSDDDRRLLLHVDEQTDRLAMAATARQLCDIERIEFAVGGEQQQFRGGLREERKTELVVVLEGEPREILDMALQRADPALVGDDDRDRLALDEGFLDRGEIVLGRIARRWCGACRAASSGRTCRGPCAPARRPSSTARARSRAAR